MTVRLAVLISGRGSNMTAIMKRAEREDWPVRFLVLANRPRAKGLALAHDMGAETDVLSHRRFGDRDDFDAALAARLVEFGADWVILAGFMRVLGPRFVRPFEGRILNIHPSLLSRHPGLDTHRRALEAGDDEHGCTVHFVDDTLDGGPIIAQSRVPVETSDDESRLAARVLVQEHLLYPQVVADAVFGRLRPLVPSTAGVASP